METTTIPLKGSVGVADVAELHSASLEAIVANNAVAFDFSEATDIDASVLQLLLATHAASQEHKTNTVLTGVSDRLRKSLEGYGKPELLDLIGEIDASATATATDENETVAKATEANSTADASDDSEVADTAAEAEASADADKKTDAESSAKKAE
jgi:anti-anti-sigma regulatory factor